MSATQAWEGENTIILCAIAMIVVMLCVIHAVYLQPRQRDGQRRQLLVAGSTAGGEATPTPATPCEIHSECFATE